MKVRFQIVVRRGNRKIATIEGLPLDADSRTLADAAQIIPTEQFLERLTGCRFHINVVEDTEVTL
jgi:hypothetical protein